MLRIRFTFCQSGWRWYQQRQGNQQIKEVIRFDQHNEQDGTDAGKKCGQNASGAGSARRAIVRAVIV
jgi:hypothetical protein